jgi:TRAP-type C4-dicarboxylate transport system substrate-binding protein
VQNSQTAIEMVKAMGGAPTPIAYGELYTALQQGVVDGAENNAPSFYTSHHYEVCKYYTIDQHTSVPEQRRLWKEADQEALDAVKAYGVEIIYPDKQPFADKVAGIFDNYKDDPEVYDLIQRIQAVP